MLIRGHTGVQDEWSLRNVIQAWEIVNPSTGGHKPEEPPDPMIVYAALMLACCGGALHGIAMAIRKQYGEGNPEYYKDWRWHVGMWADGFAGVMIWPAMPFVSVQLLMPMVVVVQVVTSYSIGLVHFGEVSTVWSHTGITCAMMGVIGLSFANPHHAAHFSIDDFWVNLVSKEVILTTAACWIVLGITRLAGVRSTFWALVAAWLEGIQFITSRVIADATYEGKLSTHWKTVVCVVLLKAFCIFSILHAQQLGLDQDLSRFAGIYLVACVFSICLYGAAFFGDSVEFNALFCMSAVSTVAGIYLLNEHVHKADKAPECGDESTAKDLAHEAAPEAAPAKKASSS
jgi:hypothetical protein